MDAIDFKQISVFPFPSSTEIQLTLDNYIWFGQNNLSNVFAKRFLGYVPSHYKEYFKRAKLEPNPYGVTNLESLGGFWSFGEVPNSPTPPPKVRY